MKATERWFSDRLQQHITMARWGHFGTPVLVFPTAGGDAEEIERNHLVGACGELVESGRVKLYSCDSVAGRALAAGIGLPGLPDVAAQPVPPGGPSTRSSRPSTPTSAAQRPRIVTAGASIGAFNAVAVLCRYPDVFEAAIAMSGTYRLERFLEGQFSDDLYFASPLDFLPGLEGPQLETAAAAAGDPRVGRGAVGGHRRVLDDGRRPRAQGRAEPGRLVGHRTGSTTGRPGGGCCPQYLDEVC